MDPIPFLSCEVSHLKKMTKLGKSGDNGSCLEQILSYLD